MISESIPLALPEASSSQWEAWYRRRCDEQLDITRRLVSDLKVDSSAGRSAAETMRLWNDATIALSNALAASSLLSQVHPEESVRSAAEMGEQNAQRLRTELGLDRDLYEVLSAVDASAMDEAARRVLGLSLRDFHRAGVDQDDRARRRLRELAERETEVAQEFSKNIRDDVRSVHLRPQQLQGLPRDYIDAHPVREDGKVVVSTDYPDYLPFMTFAQDRSARRELLVEFLNRAWPANGSLLNELLKLRDEHAKVLGYADWPSYDAEVTMIKGGPAIPQFIDRISAAARESARRDYDVLLARLRVDLPAAASVYSVDRAHYAEVIRREGFDVDAQEVREYLDFSKVRAGLLAVTGRLFGVEYVPVPDAPRWNAEVATYDVLAEGSLLGRIYLDLHPREGKYKHAAQFDLVPGIEGRQLAEGVLVCNFPVG